MLPIPNFTQPFRRGGIPIMTGPGTKLRPPENAVVLRGLPGETISAEKAPTLATMDELPDEMLHTIINHILHDRNPRETVHSLNALRRLNSAWLEMLTGCFKQIQPRNAHELQKQVHPGVASIDLSKCDVTDAILQKALSQCPGLVELRLYSESAGLHIRTLSAAGIQHAISHCPYLQKITIGHCDDLNGENLAGIVRAMPNLQSIMIGSCRGLNGIEIAGAARMTPELQTLAIARCDALDGSDLAGIAQAVPHLRRLDAALSTSLTLDDLVSALCTCKKLESFESRVNKETMTKEQFMSIVRACPELRALPQCDWLVTDDDLREISTACPKLEEVDMSNQGLISDAGIAALVENAPQLRKLQLCRHNKHLTPKGITDALSTCKNLEELDLSIRQNGKWRLHAKQLRAIIAACPKLLHLNLQGWSHLLDDDLAFIVMTRPRLQSLDIRQCTGLSDAGLLPITRLVRLRKLFFGRCSALQDETLGAISDGCRSLTHLTLGNCPNLTDTGIARINALHYLQELQLTDIGQLTAIGLKKALQNGINLQTLSITACGRLKESDIAHSLDHCRHLEALHVSQDGASNAQNLKVLFTKIPAMRKIYLRKSSQPEVIIIYNIPKLIRSPRE